MPDSPLADAAQRMELWESLSDTPPEVLKPFRRAGGFQGLDIDPVYRISRLTATFGPAGMGWGTTITARWSEDTPAGKVAFVSLAIWYEIDGQRYVTPECTGGTTMDRTPDEAFKCSETDALGKAALYLGLAADVYQGKHDGSKYQRDQLAGGSGNNDHVQDKTACPKCGKMLRQSKQKPGEWYCWKKLDGCGWAGPLPSANTPPIEEAELPF